MRFKLLFLFFLLSFSIAGQTTKDVDSLIALASKHFGVDNVKSRKFAQQGLALSEKLDYAKGKADGLRELGWVYLNNDDYPNARRYFEEALAIYENENLVKEQISTYRGIGYSLGGESRGHEALEVFYKAIRLSEEKADGFAIPHLRSAVAGIFYEQGDYQEGLSFYLELEEQIKRGEEPLDEGYVYFNIGNNYFQLENYNEARTYIKKALDYVEAHQPEKEQLESYCLAVSGKLFAVEQDYDSAKNAFNQCLDLATKHNLKLIVMGVNKDLGEIFLKLKDYKPANEHLNNALLIAEDIGNISERVFIYLLLSDVSKAEGDHIQSLEQYKKHVVFRDSILNKKRTKELLEEQFQYELDKTETVKKLEYEKKIGWIVTGGAVSFLLLLYFFNRSKNKTLQAKLVKQVNEQTEEILEQKEKLEELDAFKSQLYTNITHEFRTPLTVILGMSQQLESGLKAMPFSKAKKKLSFIRRNGNDLLSLINQMLDLSKLENNELKTNFVQGDIISYTRYITESFHSHANAQNVMLKVESDQAKIIMDYDPEKFRQILSNLLSNAIKYTSSGGKVIISTNKKEDYLILSVKDTGMGIAAENLPHIFDRFYQAKDGVSKIGGTGIGLALTKELLLLLGGTIEVKSALEKGTTFTARLPITTNADATGIDEEYEVSYVDTVMPTENVLESDSNNKIVSKIANLLIVEDNQDVVEYIASCLEGQYQLDFAYNGQAGIDRALEITPEIIISDVMMPEKDGFELCETLKNDERTSHIPIVLLTAKADVESKIAGLKRGADAYLKKPFHEEELNVVLQNLLENRKKLQDKYSKFAIQFPSAAIADADPEDAFLIKLRTIVEKQLDDSSLNAESASKLMGMGRTSLYSKLQAVTGMSFNIYLRKLRLNKAKDLLVNSSLNVSEVAYEVGFNDPLYFSRIFSEEFGVPPSKFNS